MSRSNSGPSELAIKVPTFPHAGSKKDTWPVLRIEKVKGCQYTAEYSVAHNGPDILLLREILPDDHGPDRLQVRLIRSIVESGN
jgi:hypothetical protein